ncbi:MAG: UvrD-helicase domain-containing protein [Bacteroidales bacterium]|jgi:DNA helicase-2/ATP-dependent DNA helicase PcrA|nr:UvrD-helicase domain-containing protein [Bacteroidales bacterium]
MNWAPLNDLNSRQAEAVTSTEGRIRVIAGAGTGKTKALTYRYAYLVNVLGIDPANILCLTFTNKAAAEMRQRIATMVHSGDYNDFVCTIDGFCVKFLRKEIHRLGFPKTFSILDEEDCKSLAKQTMDELGLKRTEKTVKEFLGQIAVDKALNDYITTFMLPQAKWTDNMLKSNLGNYIHRQVKEYALDFDDLENFTNYILDRFKDAREYWQNQLNYIMVDEAQDCNLDNWQIIEKLAAGHRNLFVVGDPDQAIYEWRGAKPQRFVQFASDKDVVLDENYRSTPKILNVANSVISYNKNRIPKDLFTRQPEGRAVIHFHAKTESEEMEWVATQIKILLDAGARLGDFAILYRSSWQSRAIEEALMKARIQYAIWGGTRFFERKEIKDCLAYLKLINDKNDDLSFERIVNVPSRKLGDKFMTELKQRAKDGDASLFRALEKNTDSAALRKPGALEFLGLMNDCTQFASNSLVSDLLDRVLDKSGLKKMYREDQDEDRLENIDQLLQSVKFYESTHEAEENRLSEYLQDIALYANQDYRKDTPTVKMMTIHQAKGLEFPFVFIIGLSEGIFPNMRTIREYKKNGEEEERRLMYVAITRAQKALFLTESEGFNASTKMNKYPSRFLTEIKREMFVTEGFMPEDLWKGTRNMMHVLDEETYNPGDRDDFASERTEYDSPFEVGDVVVHNIFGVGTVVGVNKENTTFEVRFKDGDTRHLRADFLRLQDLPE